jgi:hypothetical protein
MNQNAITPPAQSGRPAIARFFRAAVSSRSN